MRLLCVTLSRDVILTKNPFFSHTYCRYCGPSRLKALARGDYKFGGGNSRQRYERATCMNIPRRSTLRSQFCLVTFKRGCSLGKIHPRHSFPFFSSLFQVAISYPELESFIRAVRWCLLSSSIIAEIPAETHA